MLLFLCSRKWSILQHTALLFAPAGGKSTEAEDTAAAAEVQQEHVRLQMRIQDLQKQVSKVM
jgi:gas vesicle protein